MRVLGPADRDAFLALDRPGPGRQRLRRLPRPHAPTSSRAGSAARCGAASRGPSWSPPATRRQPRAGPVHPGRRRAPSPSGRCARRRTRVHHRRARTSGRGAVGRRRARAGGRRGRCAGASRTCRSTDARRWSARPAVRRTDAATTSTRSTRPAWRCTPRRSASRPRSAAARDLYRARVQQLIGRGWSFASFERRPGASSRPRSPARRRTPPRCRACGCARTAAGEGLAARGMAAVVAAGARAASRRSVSLYVNEWNTPARAAYARVGFERDRAPFSTADVLTRGPGSAAAADQGRLRVACAFSQAARRQRTVGVLRCRWCRWSTVSASSPPDRPEPLGGVVPRRRRAPDAAQGDAAGAAPRR